MKIVKIILLIPVLLIVLGVVGTNLNKAYWDRQVRLLCEKDGGVTVYERVEVSKADYPSLRINKFGRVIFPSKQSADDSPFYIQENRKYLNTSNPTVSKYIRDIVRMKDGHVQARLIYYSRVGGDMPTGIAHPSQYSCKNWELDTIKFFEVILVRR